MAARKKPSKKKAPSRKKAPGKAVATRKTTAVANWRDELAKRAQAESEHIPAGTGNTISLGRNGQFKFQGGDLGDEMDIVIVAHIFTNKYFDTPYDADNPTPPACFAIGTVQENLAPHDSSPDKQAEACADCWANEWATGVGRGKACGNRYRLAIVHADVLASTQDIVFMEVPPTSLAEFNKYVNKLNKAAEVPSWAVVTKVYFDEHKDQQALKFELVEMVSDDLLGDCMALNEVGLKELMTPPDVSGYKKPTGRKKAAKKKAGKKTSRKAPASRKAAKKKRSRFSG